MSTKPDHTRIPTWSKEIESNILALRKANPCYGKYKIKALLKRECGIQANIAAVVDGFQNPRKYGEAILIIFHINALKIKLHLKFIATFFANPLGGQGGES
jgi:hypothetical protein